MAYKSLLPIRDDVTELEYHRPPTKGEIAFGCGATVSGWSPLFVRAWPGFGEWPGPADVIFVGCVLAYMLAGKRYLKRWFKAPDDGLRYYR